MLLHGAGRRRRQPHDRPPGARRGHDAVPGRPRDDRRRAVVDLVPARPASRGRGAPGRGAAQRARRPRCRPSPTCRGSRTPRWWSWSRCGSTRPPTRSRPRGRADCRSAATAIAPDDRADHEPVGGAPRRALVRRARRVPARALGATTSPSGCRATPTSRSAAARACASATRSPSMEAALLLATIAQRFRFRPAPGAAVTPMLSVTLRPAEGLPMILAAR